METETVFVEGLYLNKVHEKAPAFIITNQSIHVEKLMAWLEANKLRVDDKGYIRIVGKESKEGKRYMVVDTYKKEEIAKPEYPSTPVEEIPF